MSKMITKPVNPKKSQKSTFFKFFVVVWREKNLPKKMLSSQLDTTLLISVEVKTKLQLWFLTMFSSKIISANFWILAPWMKERNINHKPTSFTPNENQYQFKILENLSVQMISFLITTRRYSPLRGPTFSSCRGLWPIYFFALWAKKRAYYDVLAIF